MFALSLLPGRGFVKSPQTICYELLEDARRLAKGIQRR
jgi:hypothetical protein